MEAFGPEHELGQFIPVHYHFNMLADERRMEPFDEAIARVVKPGAKVVDLGGGTGVLSFFAARTASRVWCVERNPELTRVARRLVEANGVGDVVEVVERDALEFLPPEPVDVVICEMLHVTMLVEKQFPVIASFKERYLEAYGPPLPRFIPEGLVQAVQLVEQSFDYHGYTAPVLHFQDATLQQPRTRDLSEPVVYQTLLYEDELPDSLEWTGHFTVAEPGRLNAARFITKNLLAILPAERRSVDWLMNYLIVPIAEPIDVAAGNTVELSFAYAPGDRLPALQPVARVVGDAS
jgi:type I protein arginine methyltransferase